MVFLAPNECAPTARARRHETNNRMSVPGQSTRVFPHLAGPHDGLCATAEAKCCVTGLAQVEAGPGGAAPVAVQSAEQGHRGLAVIFLHCRHEQSNFVAEAASHVENTHQVSPLQY